MHLGGEKACEVKFPDFGNNACFFLVSSCSVKVFLYLYNLVIIYFKLKAEKSFKSKPCAQKNHYSLVIELEEPWVSLKLLCFQQLGPGLQSPVCKESGVL